MRIRDCRTTQDIVGTLSGCCRTASEGDRKVEMS
jgi:hypothetical protein